MREMRFYFVFGLSIFWPLFSVAKSLPMVQEGVVRPWIGPEFWTNSLMNWELSDGRVYYNSRSHMSVDHRRRIAWSHDGGHMWTDWEVSTELFEVGEPFYFKYGTKPSYGCNAGLVRIPI